MFHTIQSTKARRKFPSPNWIIFSGITLLGAVRLLKAGNLAIVSSFCINNKVNGMFYVVAKLIKFHNKIRVLE
jgi:hypothetical protein